VTGARARLLAVTHEYSVSGAPIALYQGLAGLGSRYAIEVAGPQDGPLRARYAAAGMAATVVPGLLDDTGVAARLLARHDLLLANTILGHGPVRAAHGLGKPALWYLHEAHVGVHLMRHYPGIGEAFPLAGCVAYPALFCRALYAAARGAARTEVIRYGVETRAPASRAAGARLRVLQLGSVEERKGQDVALAALRALKGVPLELEIAGRLLDPQFHARLAAEFADVANVRYLREVTIERAAELLGACDVLIVPSRDEVTPMVVLEAMALGKPVIAARICGIPEMIADGESGLLFEAGNAGELAAALARLAREPALRTRLGAAARERQQREWRLDQARARLAEVLDSLL
jgi:O-antigen biosynthesis protein